MDSYVELGSFDRYVLARWQTRLEPWLECGFVKVPEERVLAAIWAATANVKPHQVRDLWSRLLRRRAPHGATLWELLNELEEAASITVTLVVLERLIERGIFAPSVPKVEGPPKPERTETDHYVVVQAVDSNEAPVPGVRLELLIAGGEVKSAQTGQDGIARVERIRAGRVVIRLVDLDGDMWQPLDGAAAQPSGSEQRSQVHVVKQGECLSKIAHQYKTGWKRVWNDPKNQALRQKRKSPNILLPGDQVVVPGVDIHEITRATDATYRLRIEANAKVKVKLRLLDEKRELMKGAFCQIFADEVLVVEKTVSDGMLECELPITARQVILQATVGQRCVERVLQVSALDPADQVSGVQARLSNLGWYNGEVDGQESELLAAAIHDFRDETGLLAGDQLDAELFTALEREHLA